MDPLAAAVQRGQRSIASMELPDGVNLIGGQLVSPMSKEAALTAAYNSHVASTVPWRELFNGLEAAGFMRFLGDE